MKGRSSSRRPAMGLAAHRSPTSWRPKATSAWRRAWQQLASPWANPSLVKSSIGGQISKVSSWTRSSYQWTICYIGDRSRRASLALPSSEARSNVKSSRPWWTLTKHLNRSWTARRSNAPVSKPSKRNSSAPVRFPASCSSVAPQPKSAQCLNIALRLPCLWIGLPTASAKRKR